jgi:transcriptional regulator with XRE-family HTH domain
MNIGKEIKRLRIERGYTQQELSDLSGLSIRTIQRIENNEGDSSSHTIKSICKVLDVDFKNLKNEKMKESIEQSNLWLVLLHLSGILFMLFPPIIIYYLFKDKNELIEQHGKDVINFQVSVFLILMICGLLSILILPVLIVIILSIYSYIRIILNTIYVMNHKPYKYPKLFQIIK